jgi:hypothetical protein
MLYLPISRNWILSRTAQRVYLACAVLTFAFMGTVFAIHGALSAAGATSLNSGARSVVRFLLFPEIIGVALLWIAMWYFWFGFDRTHYLKRLLSFVLLFFLPSIGALFYYFFAYRRIVKTTEASVPSPTDK